MRLGKYVISMFLCLTLTACRVDGTSHFQFRTEMNNVPNSYIFTLDQLVEKSDYIVQAQMITEKATEPDHYIVKVEKQFKGSLAMVDQQLTVISTTPLSLVNAQYFLFLEEKSKENSSSVYQLIIHPNPIVNNAFIEGPFANMSYKDIRSEVMASIKYRK